MHINTVTTNRKAEDAGYSVAVLGGGPIGIHILSRALTEGIVPADRTVLIDPHPEPFAQWHRRVTNCRMQFLRSPASHGIAKDYRTIRRTIRSEQDFTPPYHRPSIGLFAEHLQHHLETTCTGTHYVQGAARTIHTTEDRTRYQITVSTEGSERIISADVVILAVGQPAPRMPEELQTLPATAPVYHVHRDTLALDDLPAGSGIALVGGGIAGAHLAIALSNTGHHVALWNRDRFTSHQFDSDPCFVGPRCGEIFAAIGDYRQRRSLIQRSRRPGSVPPDLFRELRRLEQRRRIRVIRDELTHTATAGARVVLHGRDHAGEYDAVVACTGFTGGPPADELVRKTAQELRLPRGEDGYPIPLYDLQWAPGLFVAGGLAELEIGPPARNLVGAHLAGRRILPSLRKLLTIPK